MRQSNALNLREKYLAWEKFITEGVEPEAMQPVILESWRRCRNMRIATDSVTIRVLPADALAAVLEHNRMLLRLAKPIVRQLYALIRSTQDIITLHTMQGCIIDIVSDEQIIRGSYKEGYRIGALWTEENIGSNAAELCVRSDQPIQMVGAEHYNRLSHQATCYAAPIHDPNGTLIAVLNVAGLATHTSPYIMAMTTMTAFAIERQLLLQGSYDLLQRSFDLMSDGIVVTDCSCQITRYNKRALDLFCAQSDEIRQLSLKEIFDAPDIYKRVVCEHRHISFMEHELSLPGKTPLLCRISISPLELDHQLTGFIFTIVKAETIKRITNQMAGNCAFYSFDAFLTQDPKTQKILALAKQIARTNCSILIESESGTGKELLAHSIHTSSLRKNKPFVIVNCASLPRSLVESELFGYEKGSFTGALNNGSPGKFELADGGTIFLDEIGELPLEVQPKLLRVLDNHKVTRIGGKREKALDVRVVAATNRDLLQEVHKGNFREDLFYRINVLKLEIPPLRHRKGDIPLLCQSFLDNLNRENTDTVRTFSPQFLRLLQQLDWPGNVRELQNAVVKAFHMCSGNVIDENIFEMIYPNAISETPERAERAAAAEEKPTPQLAGARADADERMPEGLSPMEQAEYHMIRKALAEADQVPSRAAQALHMSRSTIYRKIAKYRLPTGKAGQ